MYVVTSGLIGNPRDIKDADGDSSLSEMQDSEPQRMRGGNCRRTAKITPELPTETFGVSQDVIPTLSETIYHTAMVYAL